MKGESSLRKSRRLVAVTKPMSAAFCGIQVVPRYFIALKPFGFRAFHFCVLKGVSLWNAGKVCSLRGASTGAYLPWLLNEEIEDYDDTGEMKNERTTESL